MSVSGPLKSAQQVADLLCTASIKLFDIRGTWSTPARALPEAYAAGHIPGAVFLDWTDVFLEPYEKVGQADISDADGARAAFQKLGIDDADTVILYDDYHHMFAGRIWWAMRHWGFKDVFVLDGGWKNWVAEGRPQTTEVATNTAPGTFEPKPNTALRVDTKAFVAIKDVSCVIDARGAAGYAGDAADARTGHIPGAISLPYSALLDPETGCFLGKEDLLQVFDETTQGWRDQKIVSSCGSGYAGTVVMLALQKLGFPSVLYDGSISAWKRDPNRPLVQGTSP